MSSPHAPSMESKNRTRHSKSKSVLAVIATAAAAVHKSIAVTRDKDDPRNSSNFDTETAITEDLKRKNETSSGDEEEPMSLTRRTSKKARLILPSGQTTQGSTFEELSTSAVTQEPFKNGRDKEPRLTTIGGQLKANPHFTPDEARAAAKKEYNRRNAARARLRSKHQLADLQDRCALLTERTGFLTKENKRLKSELHALEKKHQERQKQAAPVARVSFQTSQPLPLTTKPSTTTTSDHQQDPNLLNQVLQANAAVAAARAPQQQQQQQQNSQDLQLQALLASASQPIPSSNVGDLLKALNQVQKQQQQLQQHLKQQPSSSNNNNNCNNNNIGQSQQQPFQPQLQQQPQTQDKTTASLLMQLAGSGSGSSRMNGAQQQQSQQQQQRSATDMNAFLAMLQKQQQQPPPS